LVLGCQLSERALGIHTVSCLPGTAPGFLEVEGESYSCGVFTVPQNWGDLDGGNLDLGFLVAYPGATGDLMMEMLEGLTLEDVSASPYVAQQVAIVASAQGTPEIKLANMRRSITGGIPHFLYSSIHCAGDILHERFEDAVNSYNDLRFPQLVDLDMSRLQARRCEGWPITAAPIEVKDPVTSKVPTLIL